jgi:hypothetical protein
VADDEWVFDEDFVQGAKRHEDAADVRADKAARVRAGHELMGRQGMIRGPQPTPQKSSWSTRTLGIPRWLIAGVTIAVIVGMLGLVVAQVL